MFHCIHLIHLYNLHIFQSCPVVISSRVLTMFHDMYSNKEYKAILGSVLLLKWLIIVWLPNNSAVLF